MKFYEVIYEVRKVLALLAEKQRRDKQLRKTTQPVPLPVPPGHTEPGAHVCTECGVAPTQPDEGNALPAFFRKAVHGCNCPPEGYDKTRAVIAENAAGRVWSQKFLITVLLNYHHDLRGTEYQHGGPELAAVCRAHRVYQQLVEVYGDPTQLRMEWIAEKKVTT